MMKERRNKDAQRISSPGRMNDYIRVARPGVWAVLAAVMILLAGVCVWGVFGRLDTTLSVGAITEDGQTRCYIREADAAQVLAGMPVEIDGETYRIAQIALVPVQADETFAEYLLHVGGLAEGEWVYPALLDGAAGENGSIRSAKIVIERTAPMAFVVN